MSRLLLLGILTYLVALVGLLTLNGGLLALVLPFLVLLGASLLYGPGPPELIVTRQLERERAAEGQPVTVRVTVTNEGSDIELLHVRDGLPPGLALAEGESDVLLSLPAGDRYELSYQLTGRRGRYLFGPLYTRASDFLGIFRHSGEHRPAKPDELFILPTVPRLSRIPIRPRQTKAFAGYIPARTGGSGTEFFGLRSYQPGDPLRHVNWRVTARYPGKFYTNEFEQERVADVGIILDARRRSHVRGQDESLFEYSVQAAGALAGCFISDGNRVALLRYGDFLDWTVPGYGKVQRERIMQALARARTGASMVFDQLDNLPTRFFPPKSQIVLVSPLLEDDAEPLIRIRSRGYAMLVVSPDPIELELNALGRSPLTETAARLARLERVLLFRKLRQAGIQVIGWSVSEAFEEALGPALVHRPGRHEGLLRR